MSSVRQFTDQFQETLRAMPTSSRITTGLLAIMVLVGLGFMVRGNQRAETEMLFGGRTLSEQELDSVEMSFSHAGLNGWKREGRRICVPIESRSDYLDALSTADSLPVSIRSSVHDAIEKTTIFESSSQRLAREMHAKEQDLGNKLTAFPEIRWASVEYDLGEREGLGRDRQQTASVVVCPEGGKALSADRVSDIKKYIGGSYAGMSVDDVVVIDTHASESAEPKESSQVDAIAQADPATARRLKEQARIEQHISELLSDYGAVRVAAYVELAPQSADQSLVPRPVISDHGVMDSSGDVTQVRSNRATSLRLSHTPFDRSVAAVSQQHTVSQYIGSQHPGSQQHTGIDVIPSMQSTFADVQVSIGLPQSYYPRVWSQLYDNDQATRAGVVSPPPTSSQLDQLRQQTQANIRAAVTPSLLSVLARQPSQSMIEIYDFPDMANVQGPTQPLQALVTNWLTTYWQQIALLALGFLGLSIALKVLRAAPATAPINRPLAGQVSPQPVAPYASNSPVSDAGRDMASAVSAPQPSDRELLALIEQDPDTAVDVIQQWISEAA